MTTMMQTEVRCAACGQTSVINVICSTNSSGACDLDTRPPEMVRSTIEYWVHRCPACGYCAPDLEKASTGIDNLIHGDAYRETLNKTEFPAKCNEFRCHAMICEASGDLSAAAWATIHAAWIGDDEGAVSVAAACRLRAESLVREAEAKGQIVIHPPEGSVALRSDLLRRAGVFSEALSIIDAALAEVSEFSDPLLRNLLQLERTLAAAGDCAAHTVAEVSDSKEQVRVVKQENQSPRTTFTRYQDQQFARLQRADRFIQWQANRSIERGDPLCRIYHRLRRGLIEALRAAVFSAGDKLAGGYRWLALIERARTLLTTTAAEDEALAIAAAMPFMPAEPAWQGSREELTRYLADCRHHQSAAWTVQQLAGRVAGQCLGIQDGRWLRLSSGQTCMLLRWNGIAALLGDVGAQDLIDYFDVLEAIAKDRMVWIDDVDEIERLEARLVSPLPEKVDDDYDEDDFEETEQQDDFLLDPIRAAMVLLQVSEIAGLPYCRAKELAARLVCGMRLQLAREADNAYDTEAVAILMDTGEKLGYVPRRCNAGIARRLDAGVELGAWLVHIERDRNGKQADKPLRISVEIRSPDPSDVSDTEITTHAEANDSTLASRRATRSYWPVRFAFGNIEKARATPGLAVTLSS